MSMYQEYVTVLRDVHLSLFHGAPSMMKYVSLKDAYENNSNIKFYAPCNSSYVLWEKSLIGGWVGMHYQGILKKLQLCMIDIVSHYPTSFTGYFGVGKARPMTLDELDKNYSFETLESMPLFCCICDVEPPHVITDFVSPIGQRKSKYLTWSYYDMQNVSLNSIDVLSCLKRGWKVKLKEGEIFTKKNVMFRNYVEMFAKMKDDGKREKNNLKTMCAKIGLNSSIGKYGEKRKRKTSYFSKSGSDELALHAFIQKQSIELKDIIVHDNYTEYICEEYDVQDNKVPIHVASIMYAYSRWILRDILDRAKVNRKVLYDENGAIVFKGIPDVLYGDTDSIVMKKKNFDYLKKHSPQIFSPSVGVFKNGYFDYHVTVEDIFENNAKTLLSVFVSLKAYALVTTNGCKFRCRGHKVHKSPDICCTNYKKFFCPHCVSIDDVLPDDSVTLNHFVKLFKERENGSLPVRYGRFDRILNRPVQGKEPFSVRNVVRSVKLSLKKPVHKYMCIRNVCLPFYSRCQLDEH